MRPLCVQYIVCHLEKSTGHYNCVRIRVARLGEKTPLGLLLAAVGALQIGFGTLLLLGLLSEKKLATTLGDLQRLFAGNIFFVLMLLNTAIST